MESPSLEPPQTFSFTLIMHLIPLSPTLASISFFKRNLGAETGDTGVYVNIREAISTSIETPRERCPIP